LGSALPDIECGSGVAMAQAGNEFSMEDSEKMLSFLREMETLQRTNPEAFNELLSSMGVRDDSLGTTATDPGADPASTPSMSRQNIINAISQMRDQNGAVSGLELPGGSGTLSTDGVKSQVSLSPWIYSQHS
jgi:hypothetical protein